MNHEHVAVALRTFLGDIAAWSDVIKREPWGRTEPGRDAAAKLDALAQLAQDEATKLSGKTTLLEAYTRTKVLSFADTADKIAASCPGGTLRDTLAEISRRLRSSFP